MKQDSLHGAEKYTMAHRRKKRWHKIVTSLACVVVFCTVYALILPAVTLEKTTCEIPEHSHTEECYTQVTVVTKKELVCSRESLNLHQHEASCYDGEGNLICGYADFVVHRHDAACYDEDGDLWCTLPEIKTHEHTDSCYTQREAASEEVHTHTDDCYTLERGDLICTEHVHTEDCFSETSVLVCTEEEHEHDENCYETRRELICGIDTDHQHTDDCYAWNQVLTCDLPTEQTAKEIVPELICEKEEVVLHEHTSGCFDEYGNLICGKVQVLEHQHTDACFGMVEKPADTGTLTCTNTDEDHTHTALCYGTWELTCGMEEHIHTEECSPTQETTDDQEDSDDPEISDSQDTMNETAEQPEKEISQELPVMGTAYAEAEDVSSYSVMALDADTTETTGPLKVEDYITDAVLYYRTEDQPNWTNVNGAVDVPGDADFRLEINYSSVPIDALLAAGGKMTYTLPDLLRNATTKGSITSGSTTVGTITVENHIVTLAFDTTWLEEQKNGTNTLINGDFYVEAEVDLSQIEEGKPGEIVVGGVTITIDFEDDIVAQNGNVDLSKTVSGISEETDGDYLTYTLTVTAGADGCPEVKVVDCFADAAYIEKYVGVTGAATVTNDSDGPTETGGTGRVYIGVTPTEGKPIPDPAGENPAQPGTLVWVIGNMQANETRTLTYRVKLKDEYTGVSAKENLQNTADVYSKTYQRDSDTATFTPKAGATISKVASDFIADGNGGGTITYTVWVKANDDNSYTLDNVKIVDALDGSQDQNGTPDNIRQYLSYDETSFHLYQGGTKNQNGSSNLTEIQDGTGPTFTDNDDKKNESFTYYVGSLAPGESKTLTYTVKVEPDVFVEAGNEAANIKNRVRIFTDDTRDDGKSALNDGTLPKP